MNNLRRETQEIIQDCKENPQFSNETCDRILSEWFQILDLVERFGCSHGDVNMIYNMQIVLNFELFSPYLTKTFVDDYVLNNLLNEIKSLHTKLSRSTKRTLDLDRFEYDVRENCTFEELIQLLMNPDISNEKKNIVRSFLKI